MEKLSAIILAAGMGTRLGGLTADKPKALVEVFGRPLISYALRFLREVGVQNLIVIGGFHIEQLRPVVATYDAQAHVIENPDYTKGTLFSLARGLEYVDSGFLLFHGDHIFPRAVAPKIREQCGNGVSAFSDTDRLLTNDDMKIKLNGEGNLGSISKMLSQWDCGYVGITYCGNDTLSEYRDAVAYAADTLGEKAVSEDAMRRIAESGSGVSIRDISGHGWHEVDYPHERDAAEIVIAKNPSRYA